MKQVEYKSKYTPHSFSESRDWPDSCWKHPQRKSQSFPVGRCSRNPETVASYYSSSTSYKPTKGYAYPGLTYSKYAPSRNFEAHYAPQSHSKLGRDKYYSPTYAIVRKNRYGEEFGDNEKFKYIEEELENFTEDNGEADAEEEEEDREEAGKFLNKDYEEQETDDEREEDSDATPQLHRTQRGGKKEALPRQQRWTIVEQQDPRRLRCCQRVALGHGHSSPSRYYYNVAEHDIVEPLSEEDFVPTSLKNPTRRLTSDYHQWSQSRNESDRYDPATLPMQTSRRPRTKPDADHLVEPELGKPKRCNRCGSLSTKKTEAPVKNGCRFEDRENLPTKGPIGDEPESHEQANCGRCNLRHSAKDSNDIPSPLYSTKLRKPRDAKSPTIYEVPEQVQNDKLSNDYPRSPTRHNRKAMDAFPEKTKHSLHASHGSSRISPRYEE